MKIAYKNKRLFTNLILGIVWTVIGTSNFFLGTTFRWYPYTLIILGVAYISIFLFEYIRQYIIITDEKIQVNSLPKREISIHDIKEATYYADDYTLRTSDRTLKIQRSQIAPNDLKQFESFYQQLTSQLNK